MLAIDLSHNPWHWRFLSFMGMADSITYKYDNQNTCGYVHTFVRASLYLMFLTVFWFFIAFELTFNGVVLGIFVYHLGFSVDTIRAAGGSMNPAQAIMFMVNIGLCMTFVLFVLVHLLLDAIVAFIYNDNYSKVMFGYNTALHKKLQHTSTYQIMSAWRNKICRPIKLK